MGKGEAMRVVSSSAMRVQKWTKVGERTMLAQEYGVGVGVQLFLNPHDGQRSGFSFFTCKDGNAVCAITPQGNLLLTQQYKQGVDRIVIEVPGGVADGNETPEQVGARELFEETGFKAAKVHLLGWIALHTRKSSAGFNVLVALDCKSVAELTHDDNEVIEVIEVSPSEVWDMIMQGQIIDSTSQLAIFTAARHGYIPVWNYARRST